jgi:hypothetical protein
MAASAPLFRAAVPIDQIQKRLWPFANLPGTWIGSGFNLVTLPFFDNQQPNGQNDPKPFRLKLSATRETLEFDRIGGAVPNRGSTGQNDINLFGLTYLQKVFDAANNDGLHVETGIWVKVPKTDVPPGDETVVRQATIPHGVSLLAIGTPSTVNGGGPDIKETDSTPLHNPTGNPIPPKPPITPPLKQDRSYLDPFFNTPLPDGLKTTQSAQDVIKNPNLLLLEAKAGQNIVHTEVLDISTTNDTGIIVNIPFVVKNANATRMDATFWIETVEQSDKDKSHFMQLQYTQRVILNFLGIDWPHISVATLVKH